MLVWIAIYFVAAAFLLALLFFESLRAAALGMVSYCFATFNHQLLSLARRFAQTIITSTMVLGQSTHSVTVALARRKLLVLGTMGVLTTPPLAALLLRRFQVFEFADDTQIANALVVDLLRGEQLVPPAPLPPEIFTTREVEQQRPNIAGASRDWHLLDPEFRQRLLLLHKIMQGEYGYELALLEGYRSPERQNMLAARNERVITNAVAAQSYHQYGLAADMAFYRNGILVMSERDPWALRGYALYGEAASTLGLVWGGNWKLRDYGHVELRRSGVLPGR